ncbi:MAG: hypothetical protein M1840_006465 [Geoglossum simile]|nr:MAG: hypothetical protein M1840_006465 [Geoglossum simile]
MVTSIPASAQDDVEFYTVVTGDTLWHISERFNETLDELLDANPQISDPDVIDVGDVIIVPALCGGGRYNKSEFSCFGGTDLCPVIGGVPTLLCGDDCYIPSTYICHEGQIFHLGAVAVVLGGTTFVLGAHKLTIAVNGTKWVIGLSDIVEGSKTFNVPTSVAGVTVISTDGLFLTVEPGPAPGSVPTVTALPTSTSPAQPTISVETLTAVNGKSTLEVTFRPTTLSGFSTLTTTTTIATIESGVSTSIVVGPGGIAWGCINCTINNDFPPISFPPLPTPVPSLSIPALFPSAVFPLPSFVTNVITSSGPGGATTITQTQSLDSASHLVPVVTLQPANASDSVSALASQLHDLSSIVMSFSSAPGDPTRSSLALAAIQTAKSDSDSFGTELGVAAAGLCFIFCSLMTSVVSILGPLEVAVMAGGAGLAGLAGLLAGLAATADALLRAANHASSSTSGSQSLVTSSSSSSSPCTTGCITCGFTIPALGLPDEDVETGDVNILRVSYFELDKCSLDRRVKIPDYPNAMELAGVRGKMFYVRTTADCGVLTYTKANKKQLIDGDVMGRDGGGKAQKYKFSVREGLTFVNVDHVYEKSFLRDFLKTETGEPGQCKKFNELFLAKNEAKEGDVPRLKVIVDQIPGKMFPEDLAVMDSDFNSVKGILCNVKPTIGEEGILKVKWTVIGIGDNGMGPARHLAVLQLIATVLAMTRDDDFKKLFENANKRIYQALLGVDLIIDAMPKACENPPEAKWADKYANWMDNHIKTNQESIREYSRSVRATDLPDESLYNLNSLGVPDKKNPNELGKVFEAMERVYKDDWTFGFRTGAWGEYKDPLKEIGRRQGLATTACELTTAETVRPRAAVERSLMEVRIAMWHTRAVNAYHPRELRGCVAQTLVAIAAPAGTIPVPTWLTVKKGPLEAAYATPPQRHAALPVLVNSMAVPAPMTTSRIRLAVGRTSEVACATPPQRRAAPLFPAISTVVLGPSMTTRTQHAVEGTSKAASAPLRQQHAVLLFPAISMGALDPTTTVRMLHAVGATSKVAYAIPLQPHAALP